MYLLFDYDNIDDRDLRFGVERIVLAVLDGMGTSGMQRLQRSEVRIYGGWFRGPNRSRLAQDLVRQLAGSFTAPFVFGSANSPEVTVTVRASLADGLIALPGRDFIDTYREQAVETNKWRQVVAPYRACAAPGSCSLRAVADVLSSMSCPVPSCAVRLPHVLTRGEQKLVDTMLVADMAEIARQKAGPIVLLSSDDDIWPGVVAAVTLGTHVHHFQSRSRVAPAHYSALVPRALYSQYVLKVV